VLWAEQEFTVYGTSHWGVLVVFALGTVGFVALGRVQGDSRLVSRILALAILVLQLGIQVYSLIPSNFGLEHSLPLQLSDLAAYTSVIALWTHRHWAVSLMYYWGLTLSTQALISPALRGPDFPHYGFLTFWAIHLFVIWAAIYLTWGLRLRPDWRGYRLTVVVTTCWAVAMLAFNELAGTNYGFLNAKPAPGSVLDLLGPWPWYLLPEVALIFGLWALMTWPWARHRQNPRPSS
jgi:hypothetical integral membrane protein (TIGR02206 family)